jgi:plasmid stabilization system protein ParE
MFKDVENTPVYKVEMTLLAREDIALLSDFYYDSAGEEAAIRFESAAETMIDSLSSWPRSHAIWGDNDTIRKVNLPKHKVAVIYRIDDNMLEVIAVAAYHTLQDPIRIDKLIAERLPHNA